MTPALFHKTWSFDSLLKNSSTDFLIVVRSDRLTLSDSSCPVDLGKRFFRSSMTSCVFLLLRAARYTLALRWYRKVERRRP